MLRNVHVVPATCGWRSALSKPLHGMPQDDGNEERQVESTIAREAGVRGRKSAGRVATVGPQKRLEVLQVNALPIGGGTEQCCSSCGKGGRTRGKVIRICPMWAVLNHTEGTAGM